MKKTNPIWKVIGASSLGTLIEWYDFYIFGSLATVLANQFFPKTNPTAALLSTLATFAAGFIVRPFGALVFGRLGDLIGRKHTFLLTLVIMGGSTFAIGLIPSFETIGYWAPLLVLLMRLLQGLALGGEYGGAATYVAEHSPDHQRGFYTSWIQTTATLGLLVSLGIILLTRHSLDADPVQSIAKFNDWGWRIPFLVSIVLVGVSIYIRLKMKESPLFEALKTSGTRSVNPLKESFGHRSNLKMVLLALFGATMGQGVVWYTGQFYAQSFIENVCKINFDQSRTILIWAIVFGTPFFVLFGSWSDKIGRKWIMLAGMFLAVISYHWLFQSLITIADPFPLTAEGIASTKMVRYLDSPAYWKMVGIVFVMIIYVTMVYGPIAAFLVELFPTKIRYTSMSLPYHVGNGVFGGLTPFIATLLTTIYANQALVGLYYPILIASVCLVIGTVYINNKIHAEILESK